ncbi:MAG: GFA family protein [Mesorhizobium sp.]|uniref:GFA family protein n=1 Tax=Mesorhizobium sp. TaxID=1871066 RepID=UPI000FE4BF6A|nr:GFA family protein [Mesorhizobium sp.]RWD67051.1 MAG: GFA family protein [Mesorhizobium sp.]RWE33559.1 MAG: GFA family protein [Mesorhizobium sp.]
MASEHSATEASNTVSELTVRGRCMCGDIRYEITGPMFDMVHCHCESCRRHSSTAFATVFNIDKTNFRYIRGTPVPYNSSPGVERTHCGRCGSPISYENARELSIFACTLEDLTLVKPQAHIMVGEMLPWLDFGDDLPCFERGLHGKPSIGHGPSNLPRVSVESVRANSETTNAARDNFKRGNAPH